MSNRRRNKPKRSESQPNPSRRSDGASTPAADGARDRRVIVSHDPASRRKGVKDVFLDHVAGNVFSHMMRPFVSDDANQTSLKSAAIFVEAIKESVQPRDAIEEMLLLQLAWTHARIARLSSIAPNQTSAANVRVVNDACDRATNMFRRMMLALSEYRRPPRNDSFVAIRQANVANQQVVQNVQGSAAKPENPNATTSNEQGCVPPSLPPIDGGTGFAEGSRGPAQTVAQEHRPAHGERENEVKG